jgi:hypothetical protein
MLTSIEWLAKVDEFDALGYDCRTQHDREEYTRLVSALAQGRATGLRAGDMGLESLIDQDRKYYLI